MDDDNLDYATGEPRNHHQYYISSGDIVLQVEKAIFKVHRFFLSQYSNGLNGMLEMPVDITSNDGTDETPLVLRDDSVKGWELVFRAIYRTDPISAIEYTSPESVALLRIAHKYCMDTFERAAVTQLQKASTVDEYVELMAASQLLASETMYTQALRGLDRSWPVMSLEQAQKIGLKAFFEVVDSYRLRCYNCGLANQSYLRCGGCSVYR